MPDKTNILVCYYDRTPCFFYDRSPSPVSLDRERLVNCRFRDIHSLDGLPVIGRSIDLQRRTTGKTCSETVRGRRHPHPDNYLDRCLWSGTETPPPKGDSGRKNRSSRLEGNGLRSRLPQESSRWWRNRNPKAFVPLNAWVSSSKRPVNHVGSQKDRSRYRRYGPSVYRPGYRSSPYKGFQRGK